MAHAGGRTALPYVVAFDGLRGLAVLAVVAYHASLAEAPGGFFGVDVFFVISGYLVTALFLARARRGAGGGADAGVAIPDGGATLDFWRRRLLRLVPAAVTAVAVTWGVFTLFEVRAQGTLTAEALSAVGYFANWFFLFSDQSYFETIASPSPFLHFWSLAVEAQFYLVWPVLLIAALRFGGRLTAFALAVSLAAISTLVVAGLYSPTADPSRAYYGTDARVAGLLLGAALAVLVKPAMAARAPRVPIEIAGWLGLVVLAWMVMTVSEFDPFIYRGGFFLASTAALAVLVASLHASNSIAWLLSVPPLRWLGERSYSIYLWHWPVFVLTQPHLSADLHSPSLLLARLGATLVLADLSYRLVESRFRSGGLWRLPRIEFGRGPLRQRPWAAPAGVLAVGLLSIALAGGLPVRSGLANDVAQLGEVYAAAPAPSDAGAAPEDGTGAMTSPDNTGDGAPDAPPAGEVLPAPSASPTSSAPPSEVVAAAPGTQDGSTRPSTAVEDGNDAHARPPEPSATEDALRQSPPEAEPTEGPTVGVDLALSSAVASSGSTSSGSSGSVSEEAPASTPAVPPPTATPDPAPLGTTVTVIGDSVALGAADALAHALPGALVDAEVGRQFWGTPDVIAALAARGGLGEVVVMHLGANGPFTGEQFDRIMTLLEGRTVVWVNITVPRRWEGEVNQGLVSRTAGLPNVSIADWHGFSSGNAALFVADGVHLSQEGKAAYAAVVQQAVSAAIAARG